MKQTIYDPDTPETIGRPPLNLPRMYRAQCYSCGARIVSDISRSHFSVLLAEHAAYHTRVRRERAPVFKVSYEVAAEKAESSSRGLSASAA